MRFACFPYISEYLLSSSKQYDCNRRFVINFGKVISRLMSKGYEFGQIIGIVFGVLAGSVAVT